MQMKHTLMLTGCIAGGLALMLVTGCGNRACVLAEPLSELPCGLCSWCWTDAPPCPTACPPECLPDCTICPKCPAKGCPICPPKAAPCPDPCAPCPDPCAPCAAPCPQVCPTQLHAVVTAAVEEALASKGYIKSAQGGPTFLVSQQSWLVRVCNGVAQDPYFQNTRATVYTSYDLEPRCYEDVKEQARVIVEFRQTKDCPPFWRGMATVNLDSDATGAERAEQVRCTVKEAIMKFPSRAAMGG